MKNSYSVNENNNLLISTKLSSCPLVSRGRFKINKKNELEYVFNETSNWRAVYDLPGKLTFKGKWRLDSNHDLALDVREKKTGGYSLILKGLIVDAEKSSLTFRIKNKTKGIGTVWYSLKLKGSWQADKFNRIVFYIEKKQLQNKLIFKGSWDVNKGQSVEYTYRKTELKTKTKIFQKVTFNGFWQINERNRLKYIISKDQGSYFNFKVFLGSKNIYPKKGEIKFRIGVGLGKKRRKKVITLYGAWKLHRKMGLSYELDYGNKKVRAISFNFDVKLNSEDSLVLSLKSVDNKPIGLRLTYKRKILRSKDLEYFLRMKKGAKGIGYKFGATLRF